MKKVKGSHRLKYYRNSVLKLPVDDYKKLKTGNQIDVKAEIYNNNRGAFELIKQDAGGGKKNGN